MSTVSLSLRNSIIMRINCMSQKNYKRNSCKIGIFQHSSLKSMILKIYLPSQTTNGNVRWQCLWDGCRGPSIRSKCVNHNCVSSGTLFGLFASKGCVMIKSIVPQSTKFGKRRQDVLKSLLMSLWNSHLACWVWMIIASIAIVLVFAKFKYVAWISFLAPISWLVIKWKVLIFEVLLLKSILSFELGLYSKWSQVDDGLYLGGIPIDQDAILITKKLGVTNILSILDGAEVNICTFVGKPVSPTDWTQMYNVQQLVLYMSEFNRSIDIPILHKAADFLNRILSNGQKVYVHCTSGRWQGAVMVLAYFIKYRQCDVQQAYTMLIKSRNIGFAAKSPEMESLAVFQRSFRTST